MLPQLSQNYVGYSVSWGTMVTKDVAESIITFLTGHNVNAYLELASRGIPSNWDTSESDMFLNEDMWDVMDEIAPEDCYFGSHPGDGADFGFWPSEDSDLWE